MECPYCLAEVDERALACRHCGRDLVLVPPLLRRVAALEAKLAAFETAGAPPTPAGAPAAAADAPIPRLPQPQSGVAPLLAGAAGLVGLLLAAHAMAVLVLDLPVLWLRLACVLLPAAAAARMAWAAPGTPLWRVAAAGMVAGAAAVVGMSASVSAVDGTPVLPASARDRREAFEFACSIGSGWLAEWLAARRAAVLPPAGGPAGLGQRMEAINGLAGGFAAVVSTVVSVVAGLRSLLP